MFYYYWTEHTIPDGTQFTRETLERIIRFVMIDDERLERKAFPLHIGIRGLSFDELKQQIDAMDPRDREGIDIDYGFTWKITDVIQGDTFPEVHVQLTRCNWSSVPSHRKVRGDFLYVLEKFSFPYFKINQI